ncbi:uncharacterized protein A4U43_C01F21190 [Asparagus officinalis]|uniref:Uncharacterized protein n=1 Tax=Asparagus officinalis TaxID=4686 RepID=A0A5P1FVG2_ASPOF|nr:uncharacterized protein A4U43_C01F21190 [Asparagus officinalis]
MRRRRIAWWGSRCGGDGVGNGDPIDEGSGHDGELSTKVDGSGVKGIANVVEGMDGATCRGSYRELREDSQVSLLCNKRGDDSGATGVSEVVAEVVDETEVETRAIDDVIDDIGLGDRPDSN